MYESPIDVIYKDIVTKVEDGIFKAVQNVNIVVDRDELLKALQYDRNSYLKGFEDGSRVVHGKWISKGEEVYCSECNFRFYPVMFKFCPNCGAKMEVKE